MKHKVIPAVGSASGFIFILAELAKPSVNTVWLCLFYLEHIICKPLSFLCCSLYSWVEAYRIVLEQRVQAAGLWLHSAGYFVISVHSGGQPRFLLLEGKAV